MEPGIVTHRWKIFSNLLRAEQYIGNEVPEKDQEAIHELAEQLRDKKKEK